MAARARAAAPRPPSAASPSTGRARSASPRLATSRPHPSASATTVAFCSLFPPSLSLHWIDSSCGLRAGSSGGGSKATPSLPSGGASLGGPAALVLGLAAAAVYAVAAAWAFVLWFRDQDALRRVNFRFSERAGGILSALCLWLCRICEIGWFGLRSQ
jgi:hypothetical protein